MCIGEVQRKHAVHAGGANYKDNHLGREEDL